MNTQSGNMTVSTIGASLLVIAGLFLVGMIVILDPPGLANHPYILPILIGLIAFPAMIFTILYATRVTHSIGAGTDAHAFGMPPGSIRAILASGFMVLVLIFGIFSITIAGPNSKMHTVHRISISDEADTTSEMLKYINKYPQSYLLTARSKNLAKGTGGEIFVQREMDNASSIQLAQQVLTMLATALTAIVGFYFGSRTASEPDNFNNLKKNRQTEIKAANFRHRLQKVNSLMTKYGGDSQMRGSIGDYPANEKIRQDRIAVFDVWLAKIPTIRNKINELESSDTGKEWNSELESIIESEISAFEADWEKIEDFFTKDSFEMFDTLISAR